jgi:hypothetical protein
MRIIFKSGVFSILLLQLLFNGRGQPVVNYLSPDTVCVGEMVTITNLTTGGSTFFWSFCSGNTSYNPTGVNIGNPGNLLNIPTYITLVKDGNDCYSFIPCQGNKNLIRYFHGSSFSNYPISWTDLGGFGMLSDTVMGIRIRYDNGQWIGILNNNNRLVRLNFGTSPGNIPTASLLGPYSMLNTAHCLEILKEGNTWIGFITCTWGNKLVRLNFGNSLLNNPILTDLGTPGGLNMPAAFCMMLENGNWYSLHTNAGNNTHSRLTFGASLLNNPAGVNLGNLCNPITLGGITVIRDCESSNGFQLNYIIAGGSPNLIWRLNMPSGITGPITGIPIGNIGNLNRPAQFSELFRDGDTLFLYVSNRQNFTLTRLRFIPCNNASVPSSIQYNPPPFSYNQTGTYNIQLIVNEGMVNQTSLCKNIDVMPPPEVNLGNDLSICTGTTTVLNAGPGFTTYLWSTGATSQTITVGNAGSYWVKVTKYGCEDWDTVVVSLFPLPNVNLGPDTAICDGQLITFNAGFCIGCSYLWSNLTTGQPNIGTGVTYTTGTAGVYSVRKTDGNGCINRDTVELFTIPEPLVTNWPLVKEICSGDSTHISLTSNIPGSTFSWAATLTSGIITGYSNGSGTVIEQVLTNLISTNGTVTYTITASYAGCSGPPRNFIVVVKPVPLLTTFPLNLSICSGDTANIFLQSNIPNATFSWTASSSSPYLSGYAAGSDSVISQIIINTGYVPETVTYHITPSANNCDGQVTNFVVLIKPIPNVFFDPPTQDVCNNTYLSVNLISQVSGTVFPGLQVLQYPIFRDLQTVTEPVSTNY